MNDSVADTKTPKAPSVEAQALHAELMGAAQSAAARNGAGWAQIHEDRVGGVERVQSAIDELRAAGIHVGVSGGERDRFISLGERIGA